MIFLVPSFDLFPILKTSYGVYQTGFDAIWTDGFFSSHIRKKLNCETVIKIIQQNLFSIKENTQAPWLFSALPHKVDILHFHSSMFLKAHP